MGGSPARCMPSAAGPRRLLPQVTVPAGTCRSGRNPGRLRYFPAVPLALAGSRPFGGANPGSQLVAVVTEVPGFGVADVRACRVEGNDLKRLIEGSRFRCLRVLWLACWCGRSRRVAGGGRLPRAWGRTG